MHGDFRTQFCCRLRETSFHNGRVRYTDWEREQSGITVWRLLRWLEVLWALTVIGPCCIGGFEAFACFACVCDGARWRTTCHAPHTCYNMFCTCSRRGAIWYAFVTWSAEPPVAARSSLPLPLPLKALPSGGATEKTDDKPTPHVFETDLSGLPIAVPIIEDARVLVNSDHVELH